MYIHLNTHSAYSFLEGLPTPEDLVNAAVLNKMPALGLTDHQSLTGTIEFVSSCKNSGLQPIIGLEIDMESGNRLALLACSSTGWSNLCCITSALALQDNPTLPCNINTLSAHSSDLIALASENENLGELKEIFQGSLYISFHDPDRGLPLIKIGKQFNIPLVAAHPVFYIAPQQAVLQKTITAIKYLQPISQVDPGKFAAVGSYFLSQSEMENRFQHFPRAIDNTIEIAKRCKFELPVGIPHMPKINVPNDLTQAQYLSQKAESGAIALYSEITPEIRQRLDHELQVISKMGYEPIFLIVEEILNYTRDNQIPFSSRGSAASSLVAHCLGITSPDPIKLDLYFERFLNPARSTPPDIDTDLCSIRRDEVIKHVFQKYGMDRVAMVATISRFRPRSALGDTARAHGFSQEKIRRMVNYLPYAFWERFEQSIDGEAVSSPFQELRNAFSSPDEITAINEAEALLKLPRHLSLHPGGLIVAPGKLTDLVPVMRSNDKNILVTQLDLDSVEAFGLVKIDLLGIRGLSVLGDITKVIPLETQMITHIYHSVLDSIPAEDQDTSERIEIGQTIGCFQIESPGMRSTLREIHAKNEFDIMAALALYRPGPLSGGLKDAFVRRYKGLEKVQHIHPSLAPLLDETFGVILYQEQVLRIAHDVAGFSMADADLLRRGMSHFDPSKKMQELKNRFIKQAEIKSNISLETGERIWEMMAAFAGYGFPKAHAASYAKVAWRSAWCKTHFPADFLASVLTHGGGYYGQRVYINEARRLGILVKAPNVNYSKINFTVDKTSQNPIIYMGFAQVKDLTKRTIANIIKFQPFQSMDEFLQKVDPRTYEAENLAKIGAFDNLGTIPAILNIIQHGWMEAQFNLFSFSDGSESDWSIEQKMTAQNDILGIGLVVNPLEMIQKRIDSTHVVSTIDAAGKIGQHVTLLGLRQTSHQSQTKKGEKMMFLTLEDLTGNMDVILFPRVFEQAKNIISSTTPFLVYGHMEYDPERGEPFLTAEKVIQIT